MSFVSAAPQLVQDAAQKLAALGTSLADATAAATGPTTGIVAAAQDEVSIAISSIFGTVGREFQALGAQAEEFHTQFVQSLTASAGAYRSAESAAAATLDPAARWQQVFATTRQNAQTVFSASGSALNSFVGGAATALRGLPADPATFFGNLRTAAQSVTLVGAPQEVASAVVQHTLGGVTYATGGPLNGGNPILVDDVHVQVYEGLAGLGDFGTGGGTQGALVGALTNFASSPLSGVLMGAIGPVVSPGVQLFNDAQSIAGSLTGGNPSAALTHLVNTPANVVNAFFNGATLNLDPLAPAVNPFVVDGSDGGEQLTGLSIAFGGLFSPGQVVDGPGGPAYYGVGGSALNAIGMNFSFYPPDDYAGGSLVIPAIPVGPIGAAASLLDIVGRALGGSLLG